MSLIKKLAGQTVVYGIGSILPRVLHLIVLVPYLTRVFNDDTGEYGIHAIMYAFAGLIIGLFTFRMETALFRFGSKDNSLENTFSTAFTAVSLVSLLALGAILFQSENIASILTKPEDQHYVQYFAFICFLDILVAIPFAKLRLQNKAMKFSSIKVISVLVNIAVMVFLLEILSNLNLNWISYDPDQRLAYVFIANIVGSAVTVLLLSKEIFQNTWSIDKVLFKKMFQYTWPLALVGLAGSIMTYQDRWLINTFSGGTEEQNEIATGIYSAAVKFAVIMQLFIQAFNYAAEPFFFRQADSKEAPQTYADVARAFTLVGSIAFLAIYFYLDILQNILGENFRGGLNIVPILLLAYLFLGLYYNISIWYKIKDKTKIGALISVGGAIISLSINIYLIPKMGIIASAWAAFFTFGSMVVMGYLIGRKYYPVPYRLDRIVSIIVLAVGFYMLTEFLHGQLNLGLGLKLAVNSLLLLLYVGMMWLWEKKFYQRILKD